MMQVPESRTYAEGNSPDLIKRAEVARFIADELSRLIVQAKLNGLWRLADKLEAAKREADLIIRPH